MAHVYAYAEGRASKPIELETAELIDHFGVQAVMGRPLYTHELKEISYAISVFGAYRSREMSGNWADWTTKNPSGAELLSTAGKLADERY